MSGRETVHNVCRYLGGVGGSFGAKHTIRLYVHEIQGNPYYEILAAVDTLVGTYRVWQRECAWSRSSNTSIKATVNPFDRRHSNKTD